LDPYPSNISFGFNVSRKAECRKDELANLTEWSQVAPADVSRMLVALAGLTTRPSTQVRATTYNDMLIVVQNLWKTRSLSAASSMLACLLTRI